MSARCIAAVTALAALVLPVISVAGQAQAAIGRPRSCASWQVVPSTASGQFNAVAATSAKDAWAVGFRFTGGGHHTLIEHWNGATWSVVPSPNPGGGFHGDNTLGAVVALTSRNAWAFGFFEGPATSFRTLILHWNGSHWSVVPSPNSGAGENTLASAVARSASNIWAVGYTTANSHRRTLTEHWNGGSWSIVPSPSVGTGDNFLFGVAAAPGGPVLAVGSDSHSFGQTLAMTWPGGAWALTPTANPGGGDRFLFGVAAPTASVGLAVGSDVQGNQTRALAERWTGSSWSQVPAASPGLDYNALQSVASTSASDAWAVGASRHAIGENFKTLAEHWNGTSWTKFPIPNPGGRDNQLFGVAAVPHGAGFWAVGSSGNGTLIESRCAA